MQTGSLTATINYDGLGRRISKEIVNSADWNCTYHYYYDGQRMIETRNSTDLQVLKQHVWGLTYVDELVQIAINQDPGNASAGVNTENLCERLFWGLQDANYNVIAMINSTGIVVERYEYTPYGQRTIFGREDWLVTDGDEDGTVGQSDVDKMVPEWEQSAYAASTSDINGDGIVNLADLTTTAFHSGECWVPADDPLVSYPRLETTRGRQPGGALGPVGLCDVGHQGLLLDKEFGLYYNRARYLNPPLARMNQTDPGGYIDGMSLYEYEGSNPLTSSDPSGLARGGPMFTSWLRRHIYPFVRHGGHAQATNTVKKGEHMHYWWYNVFRGKRYGTKLYSARSLGMCFKVYLNHAVTGARVAAHQGGRAIAAGAAGTVVAAKAAGANVAAAGKAAAHAAPGVAAAGAGAAAIVILAFENVRMRYVNQATELNLRLEGANQTAIVTHWNRRTRRWAEEQIVDGVIFTHLRKECCDESKLGICRGNFGNEMGLQAGYIALDMYRRKVPLVGDNEEMASFLKASHRPKSAGERLDKCISEACRGDYWKK